jgi:hypothetical protein
MFGKPSANGAGPSGEPDRTVDELLAAYPKIAEIVRQAIAARGRGYPKDAPGAPERDHSASGWDMKLAGESARRGLTMDEYAALLRAVHDDEKSRRASYVKQTWDKAVDDATTDEKDPARKLNLRYNLRGKDAIVRGDPLKDVAGGACKVYLYPASGEKPYRFPKLGDLYDAGRHTRVASGVTRSKFTALGPKQAVDLTQAIIQLCGGEDADPLQGPRELAGEFAARAGNTVAALREDGGRKTAGELLREIEVVEGPLASARDAAARSAVIYDEEQGELWLPAGALRDYAGRRRDPDFASDMDEAGWRLEELEARDPGGRAKRRSGEAKHRRRSFYVGRI